MTVPNQAGALKYRSVFILGGTGLIGSAIIDDLIGHGYRVWALARSEAAARTLSGKGAEPVAGDLRAPEGWVSTVNDVDAVIHVAATFTDDMALVDQSVVRALIDAAARRQQRLRVIYTGGCWDYGATGDAVADDATPYNPIEPFDLFVENGDRILAAPGIDGVILHPAMVYHRDGGAIGDYLENARAGKRLEIWGAPETRWPVVHREDLATAYRLALEIGAPGISYNIAAEEGVVVGQIAAAVARRFGLTSEPVVRAVADLVAEHGAWAVGPTLDQQMSAPRARADLGWTPVHTDILSEIS